MVDSADTDDTDATSVASATAAPDAALPGAIWRLRVVAGVAAALTAAWTVVVLLTVGHGFAASDEGFYLLLYRWWAELPPNFTGVNYIYGPIFDLLGHNIVALRVFRLLTVLGTHAAFGWAFMVWLRTRRPNAPATRWWEAAGCLALVTTGAMVYSWLPLSPGYNDISTLGGLLAGAIVLRVAAHVERGTKIPGWLPALLGPIAILIGLAKWSAALSTFVLVGVVGVIAVRRAGWRQVGRVVVWAVGGLVLTFVLWQLLLAPLASIFVDIAKVNRHITYNRVQPDQLLVFYRDQVIAFGQAAIEANLVLLLGVVIVTLSRGPYLRWVARALVVVGGALSLQQLLTQDAYIGGGFHGTLFTIALIGLLLVPLMVGFAALVRDRITLSSDSSLTRPGGRSWAVLAMLVLLPIAQAGGSNTGLLGMAIDSLAAWVAVAIAILTGIEAAPATARWVTRVVTAVVVVMSASIAITGSWAHPYLSPGRAVTTASVPGVPALAGIKVDPETARLYSDLHERLRPWIEPPGRAIMAFDQIAGLVLLLDGRPVGEAWTGAADPWRTADSMQAECLGPNRWWGDRAPLLLFNRPVTDIERDTLHICGYDLQTDYRLLAPKDQLDGLEVYVPRAG